MHLPLRRFVALFNEVQTQTVNRLRIFKKETQSAVFLVALYPGYRLYTSRGDRIQTRTMDELIAYAISNGWDMDMD